jgi:hypothetical protein
MMVHGINAYAPEFAAEGQRLWQLAGLPKTLHHSLQTASSPEASQ